MKVVMAGSRMVGALREYGLQRRDDLLGARLWSPVLLPQIPGSEIHQRFRKQRGGIEVIGEPLHHQSHGFRIGLIETLTLHTLPAHVPRSQRLYIRLLPWNRVGCQPSGLLNHLDRTLFILLFHRAVDVGTER